MLSAPSGGPTFTSKRKRLVAVVRSAGCRYVRGTRPNTLTSTVAGRAVSDRLYEPLLALRTPLIRRPSASSAATNAPPTGPSVVLTTPLTITVAEASPAASPSSASPSTPPQAASRKSKVVSALVFVIMAGLERGAGTSPRRHCQRRTRESSASTTACGDSASSGAPPVWIARERRSSRKPHVAG